jgi:hypothetical protein
MTTGTTAKPNRCRVLYALFFGGLSLGHAMTNI